MQIIEKYIEEKYPKKLNESELELLDWSEGDCVKFNLPTYLWSKYIQDRIQACFRKALGWLVFPTARKDYYYCQNGGDWIIIYFPPHEYTEVKESFVDLLIRDWNDPEKNLKDELFFNSMEVKYLYAKI